MKSSNLGSDLPDKSNLNSHPDSPKGNYQLDSSQPVQLPQSDAPTKTIGDRRLPDAIASFKSAPLVNGIKWGMIFSLTAIFSAGIGATIALVTPLSPQIIAWRKQLAAWVKNDPTEIPTETTVAEIPEIVTDLTRSVNILVMGTDGLDAGTNPDSTTVNSLHLFRFDPNSPALRLVSIPRQTQINRRRSTQAFEQSEINNSPALASRNVSRVLNDLPIERYIRFSPKAIAELVDLLDGVEVYVSEEVVETQDNILQRSSLNVGWQTLNGQQARQFMDVDSEEDSDLDRLQRQQILLQAIHQRLASPALRSMLPRISRRLYQAIETNLTTKELLALIYLSANLNEDQINMVILPGESQSSSWLVSSSRREQILAEYLQYNPSEDLSSFRPEAATSLDIAIQNTTKNLSLGRFTSEYLQQQDFQQVYVIASQSRPPLSQTEIIVQRGQIGAAQEIQQTLGVGKLVLASVGDLDSDITIRLGEDAQQIMINFSRNRFND